jgi:hypothetical protein
MRFSNITALRGAYQQLLADRVRRMAAAQLNPFCAEFLSQAILKKLGIRTVPAEICSVDTIPESPDYFVKSVAVNGDLKFNPERRGSGFVLVSKRVQNAASLDYIRRKFLSSLRPPFTWRGLGECEIGEIDQRLSDKAVKALLKTCSSADEWFRKFRPTNLARIGIAVCGDAYMRILAARVFLGVTAGHFANVLCTSDGDLFSIDHARMQRESGKDLKILFKFVRRDSRVFEILGEIAQLNEQEIRSAVESIPKHPACRSAYSLDKLGDYFVERLRLWKALYVGAPVSAQVVAV